MRVKYMNKQLAQKYNLSQYPNFSARGSVYGMKKKYYGDGAILVSSGSYIYNVPKLVYDAAY